MRKIQAAIVILAMSLLAGCNTLQGLGKDIERAGETIQSGARNVQQKM